MSLTEAGHRLLEDAQAMLMLANEAAQRLHEDQAVLRGHLRLFATIDSGQFATTRLIARFLQANPGVMAELGYTNRPLQMIQEGYDAGVIAGSITDESVIARPAFKVVRYLVAAPGLIEKHPAVKEPTNLKSWPWIALAGAQFGGSEEVTLSAPKRAEQTLRIAPVLISEGVTSLREAARAGIGVGVLPDWLVREDLSRGDLSGCFRNGTRGSSRSTSSTRRKLPTRVRAFVDFAVTYLTTEMHAAD
jgi:DNA-binding transcriptional LysR family regulator